MQYSDKNSGAKLVTDVDDILVEFGWNREKKLEKEKLDLTDYEKKYTILL